MASVDSDDWAPTKSKVSTREPPGQAVEIRRRTAPADSSWALWGRRGVGRTAWIRWNRMP